MEEWQKELLDSLRKDNMRRPEYDRHKCPLVGRPTYREPISVAGIPVNRLSDLNGTEQQILRYYDEELYRELLKRDELSLRKRFCKIAMANDSEDYKNPVGALASLYWHYWRLKPEEVPERATITALGCDGVIHSCPYKSGLKEIKAELQPYLEAGIGGDDGRV